MKKYLIAGGITIVAIAAFILSNGADPYQTASASTKDKVVLFGKVDFSDDERDTDTETPAEKLTNDKQDQSWLENFIKTHKTPFSKTIRK